MLLERPAFVKTHTGGAVLAVAEFNGGYSRIVVDDGCWAVMNGDRLSPHVFAEAAEELRRLPASPRDYTPWREAVGWTDRGEAACGTS